MGSPGRGNRKYAAKLPRFVLLIGLCCLTGFRVVAGAQPQTGTKSRNKKMKRLNTYSEAIRIFTIYILISKKLNTDNIMD